MPSNQFWDNYYSAIDDRNRCIVIRSLPQFKKLEGEETQAVITPSQLNSLLNEHKSFLKNRATVGISDSKLLEVRSKVLAIIRRIDKVNSDLRLKTEDNEELEYIVLLLRIWVNDTLKKNEARVLKRVLNTNIETREIAGFIDQTLNGLDRATKQGLIG